MHLYFQAKFISCSIRVLYFMGLKMVLSVYYTGSYFFCGSCLWGVQIRWKWNRLLPERTAHSFCHYM